jgi:hypothetical protein
MNVVYIVYIARAGFTPRVQENQGLKNLRNPQFFPYIQPLPTFTTYTTFILQPSLRRRGKKTSSAEGVQCTSVTEERFGIDERRA